MQKVVSNLVQVTDAEGGLMNLPAAGQMLSLLGYDWKADELPDGTFEVSLCGKDASREMPAEVTAAFGGDE